MIISRDFLKQRIAAFIKVSASDIADDLPLSRLVADSFMVVELMIELQETCGVRLRQEDVKDVGTVGELITCVMAAAPTSNAVSGSSSASGLPAQGVSNV